MPTPLTSRQRDVLEYVNNIKTSRGEPPTLWEIANELGLSSESNIHRILVDLEKKGYVNLRRSTIRIGVIAREDDEIRPLKILEAKVYEHVVKIIGSEGYSPTIREIVKGVGNVSVGGVYKTLKTLEDKGYVALTPGQDHNIELTIPKEPRLYPVVIQGIPCDAVAFLAVRDQLAHLETMPLGILIPNFVEADAVSVFGVELLDNRAIDRFFRGDCLLFNRRLKPRPTDIVAVEYENRVIARYYMPTSEGKVRLSAYGDRNCSKPHDKKDLSDEISVHRNEIKSLGVAVAAIVRTVGTRKVLHKDVNE